jgi:hypothetical protein
VVGKGKSRRKTAAGDDRPLFADPIAERMRTVTEYRQRILAARDDKPYEHLRQELDVADEALSLARLVGDCVVAAFFSASKDRDRLARLDELSKQLVQYLGPKGQIGDRQPLKQAVAELHSGPHPIQPFHWEIEFPEVFDRQVAVGSGQLSVGSGRVLKGKGRGETSEATVGGFDAIVGNPPFMGGKRISTNHGGAYRDWLALVHEETSSSGDLVAHFFRRAFALLRHGACFGLIATNSIAQGETRSTGLRWICNHRGTIYAARRRYTWPGLAAVQVSIIHILNGLHHGPYYLDGKEVPRITAYLFHAGGHDAPFTLKANDKKSFIGSIVLGMGFTFEDGAGDSMANPISLMEEVIERNPCNRERIFPYIGGEEVNEKPTHAFDRYVINFGELREDEARLGWPDLMEIVERKVKPERLLKPGSYSREWWLFGRRNQTGQATIGNMGQVMVLSRVSQYFAFVFLPSRYVFSERLVVFPFDNPACFAAMQTRVHDVWALFFGPTHVDRPTYAPESCFETFPFPAGLLEWVAASSATAAHCYLPTLETTGRSYYEFRAALMIRNNEGLTKTYNRFHDPGETSADILTLRELHAAMDRAVLEAYDWHDLAQTARCEFLLDYEDEEDDEDPSPQPSPKGRGRKKPWRYRWPDDFRDEVLARLLDLNKHRAEQERLAGGEAAEAAEGKKSSRQRLTGGRKSSKKDTAQRTLPGL